MAVDGYGPDVQSGGGLVDWWVCYDYLEIRDGSADDSPPLGKLCGRDIPASIQSSQNHLWIK